MPTAPPPPRDHTRAGCCALLAPIWPALLLWLALCLAVALPAQASRVALVVGVSEYQHVPRLANPANDARAVTQRLERFGFQVERLSGPTVSKRDFDDALLRLRQRATQADAVVVYFAGHGIEIGGQNYLLPSDARLLDERDVRREAVALDDVLAELRSDRPNRVNLVILDACRENPFRARLAASGRSVSRGLARPLQTPNGTLIAFATAANDVAADGGNAPHSPYTQALLDVMDREPQLEIGLFFRRVRTQVLQRVPTQQPWEHGALLGEFYLANPFVPVRPGDRERLEDEAWALCRGAASRVLCDEYLGTWPQGRYAGLARTKIRDIESRPGGATGPVVAQPACPQCPEVVVLEPGRFTMGSPAGEAGRDDDEGPQRTVTLNYRLAVGRTEVTRREFGAFVNATGYRTDAERDAGGSAGCWTFEGGKGEYRSGRSWRNPGFEQGEDHPVVCVSWNDAQAYVKWLNDVGSVKGWRLLSEAEWEFAARAGTSTRYPWGDDVRNDQQCGHANGVDRAAKARVPGASGWTIADCDDGHAYTAPVRSFQPNRWGLHDMQGNALEWVQDCYDDKAYAGKAPSGGKAYETSSCEQRVLRGGSWFDGPLRLRSAYRDWYSPGSRNLNTGFRLARTAF